MTKFKSKKLLSLLLAFLMVMGVMPVAIMSASAADIKDYTLYIDGLTAKKNNESGATVDLSTLGITPSEPTTGVFEYTFNNVNFETTAYCAIEFNNNATINLVGENTVITRDNSSNFSYGISTQNDLTLQGDGSLSVFTGNSGKSNRGIECNSFIVNNVKGKIYIVTGNGYSANYGVNCSNFKMTNGDVEIKTGNAYYQYACECYGVYAISEFIVEEGSINCVTGNATSQNTVANCCGINTGRIVIGAGGEITVSSGSVSGNSSSTSAAICAFDSVQDAKVIDTDTKAILTHDATDGFYKNNTTIATKATLTAMPCEYNSTKYVSITKALEAIGTGTTDEHATGSIKLLDNVKEDVEIGEFQEITLDLNGYKLENVENYTIINNGKLSIIDSSTDKTGEMISKNAAIYNNSTGELTVKDIKIKAYCLKTNPDTDGIANYGTCIIQGDKTEITAISNDFGFCISNYGTITINAGKITMFGSGTKCAAFYTANDKVTIGKDAEFILGKSTATTRCAYYTFSNNTISAGKFSGPIVAYGTSKITVTGGSFTENPTDMVNSDTHKVVDNGNTVSYRYTVSEKADTTISAPTTTSKKYDGITLYATAVPTVSADTVITYETAPTEEGPFQSCNETPAVKDVGTIYVRATAKNPDYKTVSIVYAMSVTKRDVILTSASDSKKYDSTPLTNNKVTVSGDGFAGEEGAEYTVTGSQTEVGESENTFTYKFNQGTKSANYNISTVYGTLTVVLSDKDRFKIYKDELIAGLEVVNGEHDSRYSSKTLDEAKSDIADYIYDESKSYEGNVAAVDAIRDASVNKVMTRHNFIFSCPFMSFIAEIMEPVFAFLKSLFA